MTRVHFSARIAGVFAAIVCVAYEPVSIAAPPAESSVSAPAELAEMLRPLAAQTVSGFFEECRTIPGFPRPMLTSGRFSLEGDRLEWLTEKPFKTRMTVSPEGVFTEAHGTRQAMRAEDIPAAGRAGALLAGVMGGRFEALSELFDVSAKREGSRILITALPREQALAAVFSRIEAQASDHLEALVMTSPQGETTEIRFSDVTVSR